MSFFMDIIKGTLIGIANVIPGVSGGTMAVSLGIYDKLIGAISTLLADWKKSLKILLPILLGCAIGVTGFTYAIEYLLSSHTYLTCMAFVGLILGGVPMLFASLRKEMKIKNRSLGLGGILSFLALFFVALFLPMMSSGQEILKTFTITPLTLLSLFIIGMIASATMVVPGVSGSLVMMILGYYYGIIQTIKNFLDSLKGVDLNGILHNMILLAPFGLGMLLGIFLIARLITYLFRKFGIQTYCAIFGLIAASPFAIFYNTGLTAKLGLIPFPLIMAGILLAAMMAVLTWYLGKQ